LAAGKQLNEREQSVMKREHLLSLAGPFAAPADASKVGRNDRCPCGSGWKYKRCHGM
jgi:uncharacterized protein YecA (UPF0149 family)